MIRPPPAAAAPSSSSQQLPNQSLANPANGVQNPAQIQPQSQVPFMGNVHGNMPPPMFQPGLMMNFPNPLMGLHNNPLAAPQFAPGNMGFALQNNGCNMNPAANFQAQAQGQFNMVPGVNQMNMNPCLPLAQFLGQNMPNLVQQLNQNMGFNGQFCLPFQNMSQHVVPGQMLNMSQVPHTSYGAPNQAVPMAIQNPAIYTVQPFGVNQPMHQMNQNPQNFIPQATGGAGPKQFPGSAQPLQGNSTMPFNSSAQPQQARNLQSPAFVGSQGNSSINDGGNRPNSFSKNLDQKNFRRNSKKGFQKNQIHHMKNEKKKFGFPGGQKGFNNERRNKFGGACSIDQVKDQNRSLSLVYTEQEIQQWREARRKNYPSSTNVQKKLTEKQANCTLVDKEAQLLRQELREILAKQAELGVEVAEIPPEYLSYSEKCDNQKRREDLLAEEKAEGPLTGKEKSRNRSNKRGRHDKKSRSRKKGKSERHLPNGNMSPLVKREPTLLQKLLQSDMKREKSHLLQALRFMVMNSFFKEWPNKPLKFPSVMVKDDGGEINVADENKPLSVGNFSLQGTSNSTVFDDDDNDDDNDNIDNNDVKKLKGYGIQVLEEEEGEIID